MRNTLIDAAEQPYRKAELPHFRVGDTVSVAVKIVEGEKERVQNFIGVVIARRGQGLTETFAVRRIVNNEGVERVFPLHSPKVLSVDVLRSGVVRRAKLYYLRRRFGKRAKLRERRVSRAARDAANNAQSQQEDEAETQAQSKELAEV
ncbi:MAG: 50S ribosomal protein L19 [Phycisphaerales bacterium]|nr:MAG: 50S ribosomal protein L19 [Phycisphaerales bacterium]